MIDLPFWLLSVLCLIVAGVLGFHAGTVKAEQPHTGRWWKLLGTGYVLVIIAVLIQLMR